MEGSSNTLLSASAPIQDLEYLYASNTNVSNFVSVKLSGKSNYLLWKAQMLCLLDSNNMGGIVDATLGGPRDSSTDTMRQYNSLVKGWIFGSVSEDMLVDVFNLHSAKAVWEKLKSICDPTMCLQEDSASKEADAKTAEEEEDIDAVDTVVEEGPILTQVIVGEDTQSRESKIERKNYLKKLKSLAIKGNWPELESILKEDKGLATEAITSDGSTILHIAVGVRQNDIVKRLIWDILDKEQIEKKRDSDGSTALHIAAIVGNKDAAELLVIRRMGLLVIEDKKGHRPLQKAYENMHLDIYAYMFRQDFDQIPEITTLDVVVNAISAKEYRIAEEIYKCEFDPYKTASRIFPEILMAIAKSFPSELGDGEKLIYPSVKNILEMLRETAWVLVYLFVFPAIRLVAIIREFSPKKVTDILMLLLGVIVVIFSVPVSMLISAFVFICLLMLIACFPFLLLYYLCWYGAYILSFPPVKKIEDKIMERYDAQALLVRVCNDIDELNYPSPHHSFYTQPILEAACQNAYNVVEEILSRSPDSIESKDKNGYDIIQLAIMNRSEKIYNLIYDVDERKNLHKRYIHSSGNNILHLTGRLPPSIVLNQRVGAALQLQRELQWREEVKKLVIPRYLTQENFSEETPDMVFTKEHKNLVKEGEQWMKTTSESCSITAALIITIVFAAAITVPGGSNQETGTPLFKKEAAFIIFAISDAISLFASSTALLVFLSILTARFSEKDFLVSLPWRLFIGLFFLLLSATTMIIAFSATLFLVFCDKKIWMLAPICGLAFIPIAFFVGLQFPLMVDLFSSTYLPIFGKERKRTPKNLIRKMYDYMLDLVCR